MKETILEINEFETRIDARGDVAGFLVVTNKQEIKLYIDNTASCCESWGYFWCNENPRDFIGAELLGVKIKDKALKEIFMQERGISRKRREFSGGIMFVNLATTRGTLQFVAYNEHNGYYGHEATVQCRQLSYTTVL